MIENEEIIRSRQNRAVVELCKLTAAKARRESGRFRFDGLKLFGEAIRAEVEIETVFLRATDADVLREEACRRYGRDAFAHAGRIILLEDGLFDKISEEKSPEGMICVAKYIDKFEKIVTIYNSDIFSKLAGERVVLLEAIRDPSNLGAVIRSAAAMGIDRIILSADCADVYHPKTLRASMGAVFQRQIDVADDLPAVIGQLRASGRRVFAAALGRDAYTLGRFDALEGDCVVIGNEGHGLTEETVAACDACVFIPQSDAVESFNAAVAASILMWEFSGRGNANN
ncbi:MAG: RNA methyltransferase [Clostridia bacterium]|nr:RNA methyltransferase [Clostridia bacterium]